MIQWLVQLLERVEHSLQVIQPLLQDLRFVRQVENRFANGCNGLTSRRDGKIHRQIGQTQNAHQRNQAALVDKLAAMVVR